MKRIPLLFIALLTVLTAHAQTTTSWKFDFGTGKVQKGYTAVKPADVYTDQRGYGLIYSKAVTGMNSRIKGISKSEASLLNDYIISDEPFYFQVKMPEGNYRVTITFGGGTKSTVTTVKAESRRLMLYKIETKPGEFVTKDFLVNVRTPRINDTESIRLKPREVDYLNWDDKLTLEFNDIMPCISAIVINKVEDVPVIFLAGNSTVVDQEKEPWAAWGQMIPRFLDNKIVVANFAESGEALKSFESAKRLDKILSLMKKGDYLFIEFAHNDQKPGGSHVDPFTTYKEELKKFIHRAQEKGGIPVLVTSMHRRRFDEDGKIINTLDDYPEAMRQTAAEEHVAVIDLNAMSKTLYEAWGVEPSKKAFVHYPAGTYPGQDKALEDNTHFSNYGAYEIARCIVEGIRTSVPDLAKYLNTSVPAFDPAHPDPISAKLVPPSPAISNVKPDGN